MEQIRIVFFALVSFFGIEDGCIAAEKTTVTVYPKTQEIEIIQEDLFTVRESEEDVARVVEQWKTISSWKEGEIVWAEALDSFAIKRFTIKTIDDKIQPHIKLAYSSEQDLRQMSIWYNEERNQFFTNHLPSDNFKTDSGVVEGNYWVFEADKPFSFTLEPFLDMPARFKKLKIPLEEILNSHKE